MPLSTATNTVHSYGTAKGWRIFIYVFVPPLILLFLGAPLLFADKGWNAGLVALSGVFWAMGLFFIYGLYETHKARHILTEHSIRYEGALRRKEIPRTAIRGYRLDDKYTYIVPVSKEYPSIRIGYTSENYAGIQQWLAVRFPNLDVQQREQEAQQILQDETLGRTAPEREEKLTQARQLCRVLNTLAWAVAAWLLFYPTPYEWALQAGLTLPPLALAALLWHQGLIRPDERNDSAYPSLLPALFSPPLALLLRDLFDFELLEVTPVWPWIAAIGGLFGGLLAYGSWRFIKDPNGRWGVVGMLTFCVLPYAYAAPVAYNCAFEEARPQVYRVPVRGKHYSSGKTTTYYLEVGAWGPRATPDDVTVTEEIYNQTMPGDSVRIHQFPGRLGIPWFTVSR
ncbi:hypothetical protein [Hymenobacter metallilatus]|uniref:Uncharacterized protein n=1 Tax=Hymenobacter metallilatus TaxID=2493666 RepID=A0A3R9M8J2_9BACT|nr:hypothetical protein [Hymenobacter metallilatus]RSK35163.1 hypothetical protein EI290_05520 [Hymenobacter metallilatus]